MPHLGHSTITSDLVCRDKVTPNAINTYQKVMLSIYNAVDEPELAEHLRIAYDVGPSVYAKDIAARNAEAAKRGSSRNGHVLGKRAPQR